MPWNFSHWYSRDFQRRCEKCEIYLNVGEGLADGGFFWRQSWHLDSSLKSISMPCQQELKKPRLFTFSRSSNVIPKKLRESNKAVLLQKEIFDEEEQTRQGFVNGDISERKRGVGWGVDEVCTLALHTAHCSLAMHTVHRESGFNGRWRDGFSHFPTVVCCVLFTSDKEDSITTHWHDIY